MSHFAQIELRTPPNVRHAITLQLSLPPMGLLPRHEVETLARQWRGHGDDVAQSWLSHWHRNFQAWSQPRSMQVNFIHSFFGRRSSRRQRLAPPSPICRPISGYRLSRWCRHRLLPALSQPSDLVLGRRRGVCPEPFRLGSSGSTGARSCFHKRLVRRLATGSRVPTAAVWV